MAHKTGTGSTKNGRDSHAKNLGIKCNHLQLVKKGFILVRQRGLKVKPGPFIGCGKDYTLYALTNGILKYLSNGYITIH